MVTRPVASGVEIELRVVSARQSDEFNVVVDGRVAELGRWPSTLIACFRAKLVADSSDCW